MVFINLAILILWTMILTSQIIEFVYNFWSSNGKYHTKEDRHYEKDEIFENLVSMFISLLIIIMNATVLVLR